ncbi:RHS repeat-associated core domain-containing protein [Pseudomonas neuropathica]|uniref:RHS repeat-associated core domain-containing protein n=1 Tax=Pseudomonas neuropathica TaxID=2730425 RepID=A0ACC7MQM6_9PSED
MRSNQEMLLCQYRYDAMDRLIDCTPSVSVKTQRFYLKDRLATEIQGTAHRSILQHEDHLLAHQQRQNNTLRIHLFATDQKRTVSNSLDAGLLHPFAYTPYGFRSPENGMLNFLGFKGERPDQVTGYYLLGNGYRAFNPVLMRFNSPDSWSPFGEGGLNAYAYCLGDPVNRVELDGHWSILGGLKSLLRTAGLRKSSRVAESTIQNGRIDSVGILSDRIVYFDSVFEGRRQLNIEAHGSKPSLFRKSALISNEKHLTPKQIHSKLLQKKVNLRTYDNIHLIACYGGNDGGSSFAGRLAKISKKPVDGYLGSVAISRSRSPLKELELRTLTNTAEGALDVKFKGQKIASDLEKMGKAIRYNP